MRVTSSSKQFGCYDKTISPYFDEPICAGLFFKIWYSYRDEFAENNYGGDDKADGDWRWVEVIWGVKLRLSKTRTKTVGVALMTQSEVILRPTAVHE